MQSGVVVMSRAFKLILVGILGFLIGLSIKFVYESNVFHAFKWGDPPIILNCYGTPLPEAVVVRAIDYWTLRGFPIAFYEMNPSSETCMEEHIEGFIIIRRDELPNDPNVLAKTLRRTRYTWVLSGVIKLKPGTYNLDLLLEHELGHALGLGHVEVEGHIMHPLYMSMGTKFWIPK